MNIDTARGECEHGRLRRACPECHAAEDIAELRAENARLRAALEAAPWPSAVDPNRWSNYGEWFNTTRAEALK